MDAAEHETALIRAFVVPKRRDRFLSFLRTPKGRNKLLAALAHFKALDDRYAHLVPSQKQTAASIEAMLRRKGAPDTCHIVSERSRIDGCDMPLAEALHEVVGSSMGTFVSCIPGRLAYFEFEDVGCRYILEREAIYPPLQSAGPPVARP